MRIRAGVFAFVLSLLILPAVALADCSDYPDPYYEDINGDGIDGDTGIAIFVSNAAGNDANPGTMALPVKTIAQGISLAVGGGKKHVYVAGGSYSVGTLNMADGISIYGQYDGPPGWGRSNSNTTAINGGNIAVSAIGLAMETHLEGFSISASGGFSNYGVQVVAGGLLYIRYNTITVGFGFTGSNGLNGSVGPSGSTGGPGQNGCDGCSSFGAGGIGGGSACGRNGGNGGSGGYDTQSGQNGAFGIGGTSGGSGASDGGCFSGGSGPGSSGANGISGSPGVNGPPAGSGLIAGGLFIPGNGNNGIAGTHGNGGGGGGGGGGGNFQTFFCSADRGGGGGAGGAAGCAGISGFGGGGGGASIGILIQSGAAIIDGNSITTGQGGNGGGGGNGGLGGPGGAGGPGGIGPDDAGDGGNGGFGGAGGASGSGSGGAGGPSVGIYASSSPSVTVGSTNNFAIASGGFGGPGGFNGILGSAISGPNGISASVFGTGINVTPIVNSVSPSSGTDPDTVSINGSNLASVAAVCFGTGNGGIVSTSPGSVAAEVLPGASSGRVKVTNSNLLEAYSPSPFTVITCAAAKGDMNGVGGLSPADVVLMLNCVYLASGNCDLCFADVNCSGGLTPSEVVIELQMVYLGAPPGC